MTTVWQERLCLPSSKIDSSLAEARFRHDAIPVDRSHRAITVPDDRHVHIYLPRGSATLDNATLTQGDSPRLAEAGRHAIIAGADGAEVLIWATP